MSWAAKVISTFPDPGGPVPEHRLRVVERILHGLSAVPGDKGPPPGRLIRSNSSLRSYAS